MTILSCNADPADEYFSPWRSISKWSTRVVWKAILVAATALLSLITPSAISEAAADEPPIDERALSDVVGLATETRSHALLVQWRGETILSHGAVAEPILVQSIRKSLMNALLGMAFDEGVLHLDQSLESLGIDDDQKLSPAEQSATVRMLLQSRSGIYHPAAASPDWMVDTLPARGSSPPDSEFFYNNWDFNALGTIYEQVTGEPVFEAFERRIAQPLGFQDFQVANCERKIEACSRHPAHRFSMSARDLARFGRLYLRRGLAPNGTRLLSDRWIEESLTAASGDARQGYGFLWWIQHRARGFAARGGSGQLVLVIPERDLVIVHLAPRDGTKSPDWSDVDQICKAIVGALPAPTTTKEEAVNPGTIMAAALLAATELPAPSGPHNVGTRTLTVFDESRAEVGDGEDERPREIVVQLWYPTDAKSGEPAHYFDQAEKASGLMAKHESGRLRGMSGWLRSIGQMEIAALRDASVATPSDSPLPLILFSPGGNMSRHFYTVLLQEWASHGFAVAAMSHAHVGLDLFSGDRVLASHAQWSPPEGATDHARDAHFETLVELLAADAMAVVRRLTEESEDSESSLYQSMDTRRVAIIGHSRGGKAAARCLLNNDRFVTGAILDNLPPLKERAGGLEKPVLLLRADDWSEEDVASMNTFVESSPQTIHLRIDGGSHQAFTDVGIVNPQAHRASLPATRVLEIASQITTAFLRQHLMEMEGVDVLVTADSIPEIKR